MDNDSSVLEVQSGSSKFGGFSLLTLIDNEKPNVDLNWLWENVKTQEYAFDDFSRGKVEWFLAQMADLSGRTKYLLIGDHGLFFVTNCMKGGDANIHFVVWDRNFSIHRERAYGYEICDYLYYEIGVHRITGCIPSYNTLAPRFATAMGMRYEGEMQQAVLWKGQYHNVQIFGMLESWYRQRRERINKQ